jgi:hypothetical protein
MGLEFIAISPVLDTNVPSELTVVCSNDELSGVLPFSNSKGEHQQRQVKATIRDILIMRRGNLPYSCFGQTSVTRFFVFSIILISNAGVISLSPIHFGSFYLSSDFRQFCDQKRSKKWSLIRLESSELVNLQRPELFSSCWVSRFPPE